MKLKNIILFVMAISLIGLISNNSINVFAEDEINQTDDKEEITKEREDLLKERVDELTEDELDAVIMHLSTMDVDTKDEKIILKLANERKKRMVINSNNHQEENNNTKDNNEQKEETKKMTQTEFNILNVTAMVIIIITVIYFLKT